VSRIADAFKTARRDHRAAFIPYITAGDPNLGRTVELVLALERAGADVVELGVPFSDPMADGPVIQAACERALRHHVTLHQVLDMVREFRRQDDTTPVILMGYLNPIEVWGYTDFARAAAAAGVDGVLTVDMPPEEAEELAAAFRKNDIDTIFLIAPTSDAERMRRVGEMASGFLYYVSFKGVTGANRLDVQAVTMKLEELRKFTELPVGVGFGIRDGASAAQVAQVADAVVVGSVLVNKVAELADQPAAIPAQVAAIVGELRTAMDAAGAR